MCDAVTSITFVDGQDIDTGISKSPSQKTLYSGSVGKGLSVISASPGAQVNSTVTNPPVFAVSTTLSNNGLRKNNA